MASSCASSRARSRTTFLPTLGLKWRPARPRSSRASLGQTPCATARSSRQRIFRPNERGRIGTIDQGGRLITKSMWAAGIAAAMLCAGFASAQNYPNRPVRIIVPYAAGGGTDLNARPVAQKLTERWGQSVVVDNRPGGNAMIGSDAVAKAAPDGYTLLFHASSEIVTNVSLFKKVPYDPVKDFAPITLASTTAVIIVTH